MFFVLADALQLAVPTSTAAAGVPASRTHVLEWSSVTWGTGSTCTPRSPLTRAVDPARVSSITRTRTPRAAAAPRAPARSRSVTR